MESTVKKLSHFLRGSLTCADYAVFKVLRLFEEPRLPDNPRRILVVERLFLGDLIVLTPVLRALKASFPNAKIDIILQPSMVDVLKGDPNINEILPYSDDDLRFKSDEIVSAIKCKYDLGIIFNYGSYRISKILKDAQIPYRIGATKAGLLTGRGFFLTRKTKPVLGIKHKVEHHMDVVRTIGVDTTDKHLEVCIPAEANKAINNLFSANCITKKDLVIVIHAVPQHNSHRWIDNRFANVADALIEKYGAKVIFSGTEKDKSVIDNIQSLMKRQSVSFAGKTSVKEYFALIAHADLLISVDTSAMHVGSAVNTTTIALFGAGNPRMWRPYGERHIVIYKNKEVCTGCLRHSCRFRGYKCMKAISVNDVLSAVDNCYLDKETILNKGLVGKAHAH